MRQRAWFSIDVRFPMAAREPIRPLCFLCENPIARTLGALALGVILAGCSIQQIAIKQLGSALANSTGGAFARESDVVFAGEAIPFSLKLIESLLLEQPENTDLLLAASSGFTQYAYAWVQQPADFIEDDDFSAAQRERVRARAFYLRAYGYGIRGLEAKYPGFKAGLEQEPEKAVARVAADDIPLLFWSAASLGSAINLGKTEPELVAQQSQFAALASRAYSLDPDWDLGSLRELMMSYELARPGGGRDAVERAREQFKHAVADADGRLASPYVTLAESVCVQEQNRSEFVSLLNQALAIDPEKTPEHRLANIVAQQRARWLLGRVDDLFLE